MDGQNVVRTHSGHVRHVELDCALASNMVPDAAWNFSMLAAVIRQDFRWGTFVEQESGYCGPRKGFHVFARIKAYALDGSGEVLFSQPYMLT